MTREGLFSKCSAASSFDAFGQLDMRICQATFHGKY